LVGFNLALSVAFGHGPVTDKLGQELMAGLGSWQLGLTFATGLSQLARGKVS
jgi:hypothetical protein